MSHPPSVQLERCEDCGVGAYRECVDDDDEPTTPCPGRKPAPPLSTMRHAVRFCLHCDEAFAAVGHATRTSEPYCLKDECRDARVIARNKSRSSAPPAFCRQCGASVIRRLGLDNGNRYCLAPACKVAGARRTRIARTGIDPRER